MRWIVATATVSLLVGRADADAKIDQLVKSYEREQTSCRIHEGGLAKMLDGATMLLENGSEGGLAEDVNALHAAHEVLASFCTALGETIEFLRSDPEASYKSIEKAIGGRNNHIRVLRASSKKALEETQPMIQHWIPKINAARIEADKLTAPKSAPRPASKQPEPARPAVKSEPRTEPKPQAKRPPPPEPKPAPAPEPKPERRTEPPEPPPEPPPDAPPVSAKFPSGRTVKLPQLGGKWDVRGDAATDVADYLESGTHTSIVAEVFPGVGCSSQLSRLQFKAYGRQATKEQTSPGQAWRVSLPGDAPAIVACAATRAGSALVTVDAPDALHPDLSDVAWAMLASLTK